MDRARRVEPTGRGFFQAFSRVHCRPGAWFRGTLSGAGFSHSGATIGGTLPTSLTKELGSYLSRPWLAIDFRLPLFRLSRPSMKRFFLLADDFTRHAKLMTTIESTLQVPPPAADAPARVDESGVELKRGAILNTIAMLASNFRGIFTFLVARMLGPAALGIFSVAWSTTDIISKIGVLGLDNAIITFIARSEAVGDHARSRALFRVAVVLGVVQSAVVAVLSIAAIRLFHHRLHLQPEMVSALAVVLCAMPGLALYRISTSVSRGMKVMRHDIFSRGMSEPIATTLAFLIVFIIGLKTFAPELAAIIGTATSGLVALALAAKLFRRATEDRHVVSHLAEALQLIGYSAPISAYQLINAFIARMDLILLGYFVGRAPGVTLATVGVYSAVIGTANGLR